MRDVQLIDIARGYLGTPYHHQGRVKGVGVDCVGFLVSVALEAGAITPELAAELPRDYSRQASAQSLRRLVSGVLLPVPFVLREPGDILLLRFEVEPQHLALLTAINPDQIIHCGENGVVEHRLDSVWRARIVRVYRFPVLG